MKLTEHFTFDEMTATKHTLLQEENREQAKTPDIMQNMSKVCQQLEELRDFVQRPIFILSGFRYMALNKRVGGAELSDHLTGSAADFTVHDFRDATGLNFIFDWCTHHLKYRQLILEIPEHGDPWIHYSLPLGDGHDGKRLVWERGQYRVV